MILSDVGTNVIDTRSKKHMSKAITLLLSASLHFWSWCRVKHDTTTAPKLHLCGLGFLVYLS